MAYLEVKNLKKSFGQALSKVDVLNGINMSVDCGEICTILGPSGSGKSTLLNAIGGLDNVDDGQIIIDGMDISGLSSDELSAYRRDYLGFVFQFYNLVPNLTVLENIQVGEFLSDNHLDADEIIDVLGLTEYKDRFPSELSGGQQQRTSIGRALIKNPKLLLCDEPTGALDYKTSKDILALIEKINQTYGTTILIVTHNETISKMAHKTVHLKDGKTVNVEENTSPIPAKALEW